MSFSIRRLSPEDEVSAFDCGDHDLNTYLISHAKENQIIHSVGMTYIARDESLGPMVLGYHTVAVANLPKDPIKHMFGASVPPYHVLPSVMLARLAVQRNIQGKGIGGNLLRSAFDVALTVKASVGCRLMIVDAYTTAVSFYEQYGFTALPRSSKTKCSGTVKMFIDLNTVESAHRTDNLIAMPNAS